MSEARRQSAVQRQKAWIPGNHAATGRESGGVDVGDELIEEVRVSILKECEEDAELQCGTFASDMNHSNMYAVGLALCTFANIASEEMSRDLVNEIEKLLGSSNTYIRKKVRLTGPLILNVMARTLPLCVRLGCAVRSPSHQEST